MAGYWRNLFRAAIGTSFDLSKELSDEDYADFIRVGGGNISISGRSVGVNAALRTATAWRCTHLISSTVSVMPDDLLRRVDERTRKPAVGHPVRKLMTSQPNRHQTPKQFKQMMTAWLLLRGNAYAKITRGVSGVPLELIPLSPDRVHCDHKADLSRKYIYTRDDGTTVTYRADEIFHMVGLTLDGVNGVSLLRYMREALSLSIDGEEAASYLMKNGTFADGVITHPDKMSKESYTRLQESWTDRREGIKNAGKTAILEEGAKFEKLSMTADDLQFLQQRDLQRYDIAMFFGVPPHLLGMTEKTTSWGSGIEHLNIGFVNYTLNDWLVTWDQSVEQQLLNDKERDEYSYRHYTAGLLKGDLKAQWDSFTKGRQWGIYSANEVRSFMDMNPRTLSDGVTLDPDGDTYAVPPNETKEDVNTDDPSPTDDLR